MRQRRFWIRVPISQVVMARHILSKISYQAKRRIEEFEKQRKEKVGYERTGTLSQAVKLNKFPQLHSKSVMSKKFKTFRENWLIYLT